MLGNAQRSSRFFYRASAAALGGQITRPFTELLEVQAASFLPPNGGYGSARVENYRFRELASMRAGWTQVAGSTHRDREGKEAHATLVTAVVEGLNIQNIVTADSVVARLTSEHPRKDSHPADELSMLPLGSYFVNLRIAGTPVTLTPHDELLKEDAATRSQMEKKCRKHLFDPDTAQDSPALAKGPLRFSAFQLQPTAIPGARMQKPGCRIDIPDFGSIYLGELVVATDRRQLVMVRVVLGCAVEGEIVVASVEGNGSDY
jgi:hypothetical protein